MESPDFSFDFGPNQCIGSFDVSAVGAVSRVVRSVFSHGVMNLVSFCNPSIYLIYASECRTRCGLGGTVTNSGSAGGAAMTERKSI